MKPYTITLTSKDMRDKAHRVIDRAPDGYRITFEEPKRSLEQNDKMWPLLREISQQVEWHGKKYDEYGWHDILTAGFKKEAQYAPCVSGQGFVQIGVRTKKFSGREMSDFIEYLYWFGATQGVQFREPRKAA